jgi:hypothetical protein
MNTASLSNNAPIKVEHYRSKWPGKGAIAGHAGGKIYDGKRIPINAITFD